MTEAREFPPTTPPARQRGPSQTSEGAAHDAERAFACELAVVKVKLLAGCSGKLTLDEARRRVEPDQLWADTRNMESNTHSCETRLRNLATDV